ncbi:MAG: tRNA pseudouridine(55) synthase TruB [Desulfarculales bacterium]|jgi:tRNA pseudouridine55 synthase|nr:tRNA pseudouridine(55) synthase TruB [Desulfarculales bacterium]
MAAKESLFYDDGIMILEKPVNITSYQALAIIKKKIQPVRVGHTGTLDPFASGILVLLFNQATRLADLFGNTTKTYEGILRLGQATDSGDLTGQIITEMSVPSLQEKEVKAAMKELTGLQMQIPPMFSAVKHEGIPLYRYARKGIKINKPPRPINILNTELNAWNGIDIAFTLTCASGVYVRSWGEDLAKKLGTAGHLQSLRRIANGPFTVGQSLSLAKAEELEYKQLADMIVPCHEALAALGLPRLRLNAAKSFQLRNGMILPKAQFTDAPDDGPAYVVDETGKMVSVVRFLRLDSHKSDKEYETIRVFNY